MPFLKDIKKYKMTRSQRVDLETSRQGLRHQISNIVGDVYTGEWEYNKKTGKGSLRTRFDVLYEGDFLNNKRHGFGVLARLMKENGVFSLEYRGDWKNGHMHGQGVRTYTDGTFYIGNFKWSKRWGYGQLFCKDCSCYHGVWSNDKFEGEGMFIRADGNRYEGEWRNGMKHGKGRFFHLDSGQMQEGVWFEDMCVYSTFVDIPFRQSAISPTKYPITKISLINPDFICKELERLRLHGLGMVCSFQSVESEDNTLLDVTPSVASSIPSDSLPG